MRLGSYVCQIKDQSLASSIYQNSLINERHRHRYEVNIAFKSQLESAGLCFSGMSSDGMLTEIIELPNHPFFIGVQFHPELKSKPFSAHPLFVAFLQAAIKNSQQNKNV
jgi:CTP synthase